MKLPLLSPPTTAGADLWRRILEQAGGGTLTDELWHEAKAQVASRLAIETDSQFMRALVDELRCDDPDQCWSSGMARAKVCGINGDARVGMLALAAGWETSGALEGAVGVALHLSSVALFGLSQDSLGLLRRQAQADALARGEQLHARHAEAFRSYLECQYEGTQGFLRGEHVVAYRGTTAELHDAGTAEVTLRPLSSFSLERSVASAFARDGEVPDSQHRTLQSTLIPAGRILSTPVTGMASLLEKEVVVLGAQFAGDVIEQADISDKGNPTP